MDVVDVVEYIAAVEFEDFEICLYVVSDFVRVSERQDVLGVNAAAPEDKLLSELTLQSFWFHIRQADLNGIKNINSAFN